MTKNKLLLKILQTQSDMFEIEMNDHWSNDDYSDMRRLRLENKELTLEYERHYGPVPEFYDILTVRRKIKELMESEQVE